MRRFLVFVTLGIGMAASAFAADDAVTKAMRLYEKRHYAEAALSLNNDLAGIDKSKQGLANLALGMIYLKNAMLHRELHQAALAVSQEYLRKLAAAQGQAKSRFVYFYLGDLFLEAGKPAVAEPYLEKFMKTEGIEPRYHALAGICLGLCYFLNKEPDKAAAQWDGIDASDPEVQAELAAVYSKAGLAAKTPVKTADEALAAATRRGTQPSMRMVKNLLSVYSRAGMIDKGLDLLRQRDMKAYSYREQLGKSKVITFYDPALLGDTATLYGQASVFYLEKAVTDTKAKEMAEFNLGQAYALSGAVDKSLKISSQFVASAQMPQSYKDRLRVWQGAGMYQKSNVSDAVGVWDELARKQPEDPELLAEILLTCNRLKIECASIVQRASAAVESGEGKRFTSLNSSLGKYHLGRLDSAKAVAYLEAGRDKANKNKIEANDTILLVSLADGYYRMKKYSEALEIYFEMSRQFPEVRQIQDAMQGVYAMEHKSAGDVKIN
jgi:tetratricopeptide (TPR) repeat protein